MEINGIAHTFLTVNDFARAKIFYAKLLPFLGLKPIIDSAETYYCIGGKTGVAIRETAVKQDTNRFNQASVGLHHLCFRVRNREDIDELYQFLLSIEATIIHGPQEDGWVPGYYSVLFEDPEGIRLEANYVPGKGLFEPNLTTV